MFSAGYSNQQIEGSSNDVLQVIHKVHRKVHGSKLEHQNHFPIPLCVTDLKCSFAPDKCGRYTGFLYADGRMINQLDTYKYKDNKVFHICIELLDENTEILIKKMPNPSALEESNSEKWSTMRQLDICFNEVDTFIETMGYWNDNIVDLHLVDTNKMKFEKVERGTRRNVENTNNCF